MFEKVKNVFKKAGTKIVASAALVVGLVGSAFAEGATPTPPAPPTEEQVGTFMQNITNTFSVSYILGILGIILTFGIVYVILYWAVRKVTGAGLRAVKKGKLRF